MSLLQRLRRHREQRVLARRAIPDALWQLTLARYPFLSRLPADDQAELRRLCSLFLDRKEFSGAGSLTVTDDMAVAVAAQACLPVLRIGLDWYDGFVGIVMHPNEVWAPREFTDDDGIVHSYDETLTGEAVEGGPLMLAWADVRDAGESAEFAYNVVIHEFAHVIDMRDGEADGVPLLPDAASRMHWVTTIESEYQRFCEWVDDGFETVLDPYGAEALEEFFAVGSEAFFVSAAALKAEQPALYELFAGFYRQDPAGLGD
jgi:MtfA peptidase